MGKLHIVDANTLIQAANTYYPLDTVPGFWDWLAEQNRIGIIKSVSLVKDEIEFPEELVEWVKEREAEGFFIDVSDPAIQANLKKIAKWVVSNNFGPEHVAKFLNGADPWIVAAAQTLSATVVTQEVSVGDNSKKIKIPNVCAFHSVECINTFEMLKRLGAKI